MYTHSAAPALRLTAPIPPENPAVALLASVKGDLLPMFFAAAVVAGKRVFGAPPPLLPLQLQNPLHDLRFRHSLTSVICPLSRRSPLPLLPHTFSGSFCFCSPAFHSGAFLPLLTLAYPALCLVRHTRRFFLACLCRIPLFLSAIHAVFSRLPWPRHKCDKIRENTCRKLFFPRSDPLYNGSCAKEVIYETAIFLSHRGGDAVFSLPFCRAGGGNSALRAHPG